MQGYRLYFMDRFSGHIDHRRDFLAENDAAAIEIAEGWRCDQPTELWQGTHKLKHWDDWPAPALSQSLFTEAGDRAD